MFTVADDCRLDHVFQYPLFRIVNCYAVRKVIKEGAVQFQYPLFRIVNCYIMRPTTARSRSMFQYPLFRIVNCYESP